MRTRSHHGFHAGLRENGFTEMAAACAPGCKQCAIRQCRASRALWALTFRPMAVSPCTRTATPEPRRLPKLLVVIRLAASIGLSLEHVPCSKRATLREQAHRRRFCSCSKVVNRSNISFHTPLRLRNAARNHWAERRTRLPGPTNATDACRDGVIGLPGLWDSAAHVAQEVDRLRRERPARDFVFAK